MKHIPQRTCIVCREQKDKSELVRLVVDGDTVKIDRTGKAAGRGAYVCKSGCMESAQKKRALDRALKTAVSADTYKRLIEELNADNNG